MREVKKSFCRICINQCSIDVLVDDGKVIAVEGNPDNPQYQGYTCIKGRSQASYLTDEKRLIRPLRKKGDGTHEDVPSDVALDEIVRKLTEIVERHGPRSIAAYWGTNASIGNPGVAMPFYESLLDSIGTGMRFDPNTIDKGGKQTAQSFLGYWGAPSQGFDRPEAILLIGINPMITYTGFPAGSPKRWIAETLKRGCKLIVIDPRETQVAQKATHFLQARPGHDIPILAAMIKVILDEELYDKAFVSANVDGITKLADAVNPVDVAAVAAAASVDADLLVDAIRSYARAPRGYAMAGTGPHMSGFGTLIEYLVLVIDTLCGRWLREGEVIKPTPSLLPAYSAKAQARPPDSDWALAGSMRVRGLKQSRAGMPTAALAEEILMPGDGQVRALISWGGNPALAFPDQGRAVEALKSLDLFVQIDPWYTESSRLAHYVLPPAMPLEVASATIFMDWVSGRATGYGQGLAHAQYTDPIARRPAGSDLLEDWEIFYELISRMGYPVEARPFRHTPSSPKIRFSRKPSTEELLELFTAEGRVSLDVIKRNPGGHVYDEGLIVVQPADPDNTGRLDVGSGEMMGWLRACLASPIASQDLRHPYRLLCRRQNHVYNSSCNRDVTNKGESYNPAYLHPDDMDEIGVEDGGEIVISSSLGRIRALARADRHLSRRTLSMAYAYGIAEAPLADPALAGSSPNRLIPNDVVFDPYTGQPRMTNVPVTVEKA